MLEGAGVGGDAARRDGTVAPGAQRKGSYQASGSRSCAAKGTGDPLVGLVDGTVDGRTVLCS